MKRLLMVVTALCVCGPAAAEPAAPVPPPWKPGNNLLILGGIDTQGGLAVEWSDFTGQIVSYTHFVQDWITQANEGFVSLEEKVETLESEVSDLKQRVAALESAQPGGKPAPDPRIAELIARVEALEKSQGTVKAPFRVLGEGGAVFEVNGNGVASFGSGQFVTIRANGTAEIGMQSSGTAGLFLRAAGDSQIRLTGPAGDVALASTANAHGVMVYGAAPEKPQAALGSLDGRGIALRLLSSSGKTIVAGGENPESPGTGLLYVGDGSRNLAALAVDGTGGGLVHAFAPDGTVGSALVGADRIVAAYNSTGAPVATLGKSDKSEGGNVTTRNPAGDGVFSAGFNSAVGGGDACVYRVNRQKTFCLGIGVPGLGVAP